jgi:hypothetical protein
MGPLITGPRSPETSTLVLQLFRKYRQEGLPMPMTLEEMRRLTREQVLNETPVEEILERVPAEEILKVIPPEKILKVIPPEKRREGLTPEQRLQGLSVDELLAALPPQMREALAQRLKADEPHPKQD